MERLCIIPMITEKYKVVCPLEFREEFPDYEWTIPINKSQEDWENDSYGATAGNIKENEVLECLEKISYVRKHGYHEGEVLNLIKIRGKNTNGKIIVGWTTQHCITLILNPLE